MSNEIAKKWTFLFQLFSENDAVCFRSKEKAVASCYSLCIALTHRTGLKNLVSWLEHCWGIGGQWCSVGPYHCLGAELKGLLGLAGSIAGVGFPGGKQAAFPRWEFPKMDDSSTHDTKIQMYTILQEGGSFTVYWDTRFKQRKRILA